MTPKAFQVGISRDFLSSGGERIFDTLAWQSLSRQPGVTVAFLASGAGAPITREDVCNFDALIIKRNPVAASTIAPDAPGQMRLRLLARNGVGVDHIDVPACTAAGIVVATTPDAVARPVASSVMAMMLAFAHDLFARDRLARSGPWEHRWNRTSPALTGRTLGVVGLGNIGLELVRLAAPWEMRVLGTTRTANASRDAALGITTVPLDTLLAESDFVSLCCPLTDETRRLIDARALARMKPQAYLINTARGEVVDEQALVHALANGQIAGAGIDVYETEPALPSNPLFALENVILGSHNLAYTDEINAKSNRSVVAAVCSLADDQMPGHTINRSVLDHPRQASLRSADTAGQGGIAHAG